MQTFDVQDFGKTIDRQIQDMNRANETVYFVLNGGNAPLNPASPKGTIKEPVRRVFRQPSSPDTAPKPSAKTAAKPEWMEAARQVELARASTPRAVSDRKTVEPVRSALQNCLESLTLMGRC